MAVIIPVYRPVLNVFGSIKTVLNPAAHLLGHGYKNGSGDDRDDH